MSGGSYDYVYQKVYDFADCLRIDSRGCGYALKELRAAFAAHCQKVAAAMRAIEWNDSGDGDDEEQDKIRACLSHAEIAETALRQLADAAKECRRLADVAEGLVKGEKP